MSNFFIYHSKLGQYITLNAGHVEEQVRIVLAVYTDTKLSCPSHLIVVINLGNLFLMSQNTAHPCDRHYIEYYHMA